MTRAFVGWTIAALVASLSAPPIAGATIVAESGTSAATAVAAVPMTTSDEAGAAAAALEVTKTADAVTVSAGDTIGFVITVTNTGDTAATNVTLTDTLPVGTGTSWSIASSDPSCTYTAPTLSCGFGSLGAGASASVHVTSPTTKDSCATYTNTASASADGVAPVNSSTASIDVQCASIQIQKVAVVHTVNAGDTVAFKITVSNPGPGTAYGVTVTDTLPTNAGLDWAIDPAVTGCVIAAGALTCSFATLAAGGSVEINVSSPTSAATCGTVENTASVSTTNDGTAQAGDSITVSCADVSVAKEAVAPSINAGDTAAFKITVSNVGIATAYNVSVVDSLPAGISWTIDPAVTGCAIAGGTLSCSFATLAAAASVEINVSGPSSAADCGGLSNTATVAASNETNTANNSSTASIEVNCVLDLVVTKTAVPTFSRTFAWAISKSVDTTSQRAESGTVTFNYTVTAAETGYTDSAWAVTGTITVTNPNTEIDIALTGLTDAIDNGGACTITGFTPGMVVASDDSLSFDYACTFGSMPASYAGTNTATATWDASSGTPHTSASGTAGYTFDTGEPGNPTSIDRVIHVTDSAHGALGTVTGTTTGPLASATWTYAEALAVPAAGCQDDTNTATIAETGQDASQTVTVCQAGLVTDSSLCTFDYDAGTPARDFRLIYTPETAAHGTSKLGASNPGQFYLNEFYAGPGNNSVTLTLPYPFVTQGAVPVHIYSSLTYTNAAGVVCLVPGATIATATGRVTLRSYTPRTLGSTASLTIQLPPLADGFAYVSVHLDYGLKGTKGYAKAPDNDAIGAAKGTITIPDRLAYAFTDSGGSASITSDNVFKNNRGIAGLVLTCAGEPKANVQVVIYQWTWAWLGRPVATLTTDADGWYAWQPSHGRSGIYIVSVPAYHLVQWVSMRSGGPAVANFTTPH